MNDNRKYIYSHLPLQLKNHLCGGLLFLGFFPNGKE